MQEYQIASLSKSDDEFGDAETHEYWIPKDTEVRLRKKFRRKVKHMRFKLWWKLQKQSWSYLIYGYGWRQK